MSDPLCARLRQATEEYLRQARPLLAERGRRIPSVPVRCDLRGRAAGQVRHYPDGRIEIRYNLGIARLQPEDFVAHTVPHEVAHVLVGWLYERRVRPHGPEWQAMMRYLGAKPERCHDFALAETVTRRRQRRWTYHCACRKHLLSTTRHNRIRRGERRYQCRDCGEILRPL